MRAGSRSMSKHLAGEGMEGELSWRGRVKG
jgi:hypothetical protein